MGVIKRGILGGFHNKVANVVGSSWKGIAVIKSLPLSVANPNTVPQQQARTTFKNISEFGSEILATIIKPLWDRYAMQMSGYNAWLQRNIPYFDSTGLFTPNSLVIGEGTHGTIPLTAVSGDVSAGNVTVNWSSAITQPNQASNDKVYVLVVNTTTGDIVAQSNTRLRSDNFVAISATGLVVGQSLIAYACTQDTTGRYVSNTTFVTGLIVA